VLLTICRTGFPLPWFSRVLARTLKPLKSGTPSNGCCGPFDVSATLQANANGGNYDITGITGTVTQNGTSFAITGLATPPNDPGGYFGFDNVILANAGSAPYSLDSGGLGFYAAGVPNFYSPSDPTTTFNVWGNAGTSGTLGTTASYDVNNPIQRHIFYFYRFWRVCRSRAIHMGDDDPGLRWRRLHGVSSQRQDGDSRCVTTPASDL
jgi:hypothetical protein